MRRLFRQFSTPGGIPSHVSVPTPGSIHEGGELGYVLVHAFGAAFDNPDLIVAAVVGDGEAETGPLEGSWKGVALPQPGARRRGAADPAPQRLQDRRPDRARPRAPTTRSARLLEGHGYDVHFVEGDDPPACTRRSPRRSTRATTRIRAIQAEARARRRARSRPRWPAIVLRTPKGWTGPEGGRRHAGRGHVPRPTRCRSPSVRDEPGAPRACSRQWLRSYRPEELFDDDGRLVARAGRARAPRATGGWARTRTPTAAGCCVDLDLPDFRDYARRRRRARRRARTSRPAQLGELLRDVFTAQRRAANFRLFCPDETNSNRLGAVFEVENRCFVGADARHRRPRLARRPGDGGAQRAPLPGLARGLHC